MLKDTLMKALHNFFFFGIKANILSLVTGTYIPEVIGSPTWQMLVWLSLWPLSFVVKLLASCLSSQKSAAFDLSLILKDEEIILPEFRAHYKSIGSKEWNAIFSVE